MRAMILTAQKVQLSLRDISPPTVGEGQVAIQVAAYGVCRTDLHIVDGELRAPKLPLVPGHEIVGRVVAVGASVDAFRVGDRVGVPWLGWTCGECTDCRAGRENLCDRAKFTGYQIDGGYAELAVADARYCFSIPGKYTDEEAAPLLCAGLIGYRSYKMAFDAKRIGLYGFGAAAHIIAQVGRNQGREMYAFTRPGDIEAQKFAKDLGCCWAGSSGEMPPYLLDAAIIFAPVGELVPIALRATRKAGVVVCAGIYMSDIPSFPYEILWHERLMRSVANLTRLDAIEFMSVASSIFIKTHTQPYLLEDANLALNDVRTGKIHGTAVLVPMRCLIRAIDARPQSPVA
jgi:alcohol dehydrogenase, propanol-preferring